MVGTGCPAPIASARLSHSSGLFSITHHQPELGHGGDHFEVAGVSLDGFRKPFYPVGQVTGIVMSHRPSVPPLWTLRFDFLDTLAGSQ